MAIKTPRLRLFGPFDKMIRVGSEEVNERTEAEVVMQQGLAADQLKFRLEGHKLQGSFALVRTRGFGKKESWLRIRAPR